MTQAAGGNVAARNFSPVQVHAEGGFEVVKGFQLLQGKEAFSSQNRGESHPRMTFAQDEPIPVFPPGSGRIHLHGVKVEQGKNVYHTHGSADIRSPGPYGGVDNVVAQLLRLVQKLLDF